MISYSALMKEDLKELERNLELLLEHRKIKDTVNEFEDLEHYALNIKQQCKKLQRYITGYHA